MELRKTTAQLLSRLYRLVKVKAVQKDTTPEALDPETDGIVPQRKDVHLKTYSLGKIKSKLKRGEFLQ